MHCQRQQGSQLALHYGARQAFGVRAFLPAVVHTVKSVGQASARLWSLGMRLKTADLILDLMLMPDVRVRNDAAIG